MAGSRAVRQNLGSEPWKGPEWMCTPAPPQDITRARAAHHPCLQVWGLSEQQRAQLAQRWAVAAGGAVAAMQLPAAGLATDDEQAYPEGWRLTCDARWPAPFGALTAAWSLAAYAVGQDVGLQLPVKHRGSWHGF